MTELAAGALVGFSGPIYSALVREIGRVWEKSMDEDDKVLGDAEARGKVIIAKRLDWTPRRKWLFLVLGLVAVTFIVLAVLP
jgi:hypothetical protein